MLLSRVAERVYWQARYLERVENMARLLEVFSNLMLDLPPGTKLGWRTLVQITGSEIAFDGRYKQPTERNVIQFLLFENNGMSILDILSLARENARTTREIMPTEAFEEINNLYFYVRDRAAKSLTRGERHKMLDEVIAACQQIWGMLAGTMSRDEAYSFVRLGRGLERADMTTRIVDVGSGNMLPSLSSTEAQPVRVEPYENILWMNILRSQSAYQMYRQQVRNRISAVDVVKFLLQNNEFPRATVHNLTTLSKVLARLPNNTGVARQVNKTRQMVQRANVNRLLKRGLLRYIDNLQIEMAAIHQKIAQTWFLPYK